MRLMMMMSDPFFSNSIWFLIIFYRMSSSLFGLCYVRFSFFLFVCFPTSSTPQLDMPDSSTTTYRKLQSMYPYYPPPLPCLHVLPYDRKFFLLLTIVPLQISDLSALCFGGSMLFPFFSCLLVAKAGVMGLLAGGVGTFEFVSFGRASLITSSLWTLRSVPGCLGSPLLCLTVITYPSLTSIRPCLTIVTYLGLMKPVDPLAALLLQVLPCSAKTPFTFSRAMNATFFGC
ncbi:hypothetical protein DFP72DRAFT_538886 [Ephemerocybe angulata]|uniref:Uncharacterized protein n=1 Tax=Ephemerocybe angulata TaxID=980116 RepID=A0A8H6HNP3_9AGAR|nr:hypothetical protein DFP72DRAFT_538886 [Tulosesus angulatus]